MATPDPNFVSSYAQFITNELLNTFNLSISADALKDILYKSSNHSFLKHLFSTESSSKINRIYLWQWRDISDYTEQQLSRLIYAVNADSENSSTGHSHLKGELNVLKQHLEDNLNNFEKTDNLQTKLDKQLESEAALQMNNWRTLQEQHANQIIAKLSSTGIALPATFKDRLIKQLILQGAGVKVPATILATIKLPTKSQKAVIGALADEANLLDILNTLQEELRHIEKENKTFIKKGVENFNAINLANKSATKNMPEMIERAQMLMAVVDKQQEDLHLKTETTAATTKPTISILKISQP
jgi:hypothetical protein